MNSTILNSNSNRGKQWIAFAEKVLKHIDNYTVKQYGDAPNDAVSKFTAEQIISSIENEKIDSDKNQKNDGI